MNFKVWSILKEKSTIKVTWHFNDSMSSLSNYCDMESSKCHVTFLSLIFLIKCMLKSIMINFVKGKTELIATCLHFNFCYSRILMFMLLITLASQSLADYSLLPSIVLPLKLMPWGKTIANYFITIPLN